MYTFNFTSSGDLHGTGTDKDGVASIQGRWSGVGNVMFWMERVDNINTFCTGTYERSVEGNFVLKGRAGALGPGRRAAGRLSNSSNTTITHYMYHNSTLMALDA